jgi:glycosyltransferase involved in cell wall biosynthesis
VTNRIASAIVCTQNRATYLRKAINSLENQSLSKDLFEIIVVDDGSEDETRSIVLNEFKYLDNLSYLFQSQRGLSAGRNLSCKHATGKILAYIDDDAVADSKWLEQLLIVYEQYSDAWVVGGKIDLMFEGNLPNWLHPELFGFLGHLDYGDKIITITPPLRLGGGNFSIRKEFLEKIGYFSPLLGRDNYSLLSNEEIELLSRVVKWGGKSYYTPRAVVKHAVSQQRLKREYFHARSYWQGYSVSVQRFLEGNNNRLRGIINAMLDLTVICFRLTVFLLSLPFSHPKERLRRYCMVQSAKGKFRHALAHLFKLCNCY